MKVPEKGFKEWKAELPSFEKVLIGGTMAMVFFSFVIMFMTNPAVSGLSVVDASTQDTVRFSGSSVLLMLIFGCFGLFILLVTKKLKLMKR